MDRLKIIRDYLTGNIGLNIEVNTFRDINKNILVGLSQVGTTLIIDMLHVPVSLRGLGYGKRVVKSLIEIARFLGYESIRLYPFPSDNLRKERKRYVDIKKVQSFYKKLGFREECPDGLKNFFRGDNGKIDYRHTCYYDDLMEVHEMYKEL